MLVSRVYRDDFFRMFKESSNYNNKYSTEAMNALYDYLDDYAEEYEDQPIMFDIVNIACSFTEYESLEKFNNEYNEEFESIEELEDGGKYNVIHASEYSILIERQ